jgi:hypothetical protein
LYDFLNVLAPPFQLAREVAKVIVMRGLAFGIMVGNEVG